MSTGRSVSMPSRNSALLRERWCLECLDTENEGQCSKNSMRSKATWQNGWPYTRTWGSFRKNASKRISRIPLQLGVKQVELHVQQFPHGVAWNSTDGQRIKRARKVTVHVRDPHRRALRVQQQLEKSRQYKYGRCMEFHKYFQLI